MRLIWRLLRQHISIPQLSGFCIAGLVGLVVVLLSVQFYNDVIPVFEGRDSFMKNDYIVITKQVNTLGSVIGIDNSFTDDEVEDIRKQPFVEDAGRFTPSSFSVYASIGIRDDAANMSTDMFFESVPDKFVDVDVSKWRYEEGSRMIPIILPRNYLDLYNFGFAQARNLPKLSEGLIRMLNINIRVSGNGRSDSYSGVIAGFSNRLNTILVPESFMQYANSLYGRDGGAGCSRLIVEVNNPADEHIATYFKSKGYIVSEGKDDGGKAAFFLRVTVGIVGMVGVLISLLAFYVLILSIYLLLEKNISKLENLVLLGYRPVKIACPYIILVASLNAVITVVACVLTFVVRGYYVSALSPLFGDSLADTRWTTVIVAAALFVLISLLNMIIISVKVRHIVR